MTPDPPLPPGALPPCPDPPLPLPALPPALVELCEPDPGFPELTPHAANEKTTTAATNVERHRNSIVLTPLKTKGKVRRSRDRSAHAHATTCSLASHPIWLEIG